MSRQELMGTISIDSDAGTVAKAICSPQGLSVWLADQAWSDKRPDGRLVLWWNDGRQAVGRWEDLDLPVSLALRARFDDQSGWTRLAFAVAEGKTGTDVTARLSAPTEQDLTPWAPLWLHALEDLKTLAETGRNGRYDRRPMLGVNLEEVDAAMATARGLPVTSGILIVDVGADSAASRAGIRKGDVLVALGDRPIAGWASVGAALDHHSAGETVPVRLWRDGTESTIEVTLGRREQPTASTDPSALRAALAENRRKQEDRLVALLDGVTEAEAEFVPAEGEWSIKQVLAHLSDSERWFSDDTARVAADEASLDWAPGTHDLRARNLSRLPLDHLVRRLVIDLREAEAQASMLLDEQPAPPVVAQLAEATVWSPQHFDEHMAQIEANLAAARASGNA